jgi:hypothetical protein
MNDLGICSSHSFNPRLSAGIRENPRAQIVPTRLGETGLERVGTTADRRGWRGWPLIKPKKVREFSRVLTSLLSSMVPGQSRRMKLEQVESENAQERAKRATKQQQEKL